MSKRRRLIWKTALLGALPVVLVAVVLVGRQWWGEDRYVPDRDEEGITRALERDAVGHESGLRFTDVTEQAGLRFEHFPHTRTSQLPEDMGSGVAWGDYDGDGFVDLFLVNFAAPVGTSPEALHASPDTDRLFRNRGDGTFEDVTAEAGVGRAHHGMGAAWGDYDADGDLDLFVTSWGESILWENGGDGTFSDATERAGVGGQGFWSGASWADFDRDGDLDLYVCGYLQYIAEEPGSEATRRGDPTFPFTLNPSSYAPEANRLFVNRGNGTFVDRAREAGVRDEAGKSLSAAWVDLDQDGWLDLYVANDVSDNRLYRNLGDGTFADVSYETLVADYRGAMGIGVGDWDNDLDQDLFITHWIAQENALYDNSLSAFRGTSAEGRLNFRDDADRFGLGQISLDLIGWATAFADFDNDGWLDLFVVNGSTLQMRSDPSRLVPMDPHLYWNRGDSSGFFEVGEAAGFRFSPQETGRGGAVADYDRDGDLDVVVLNFGSSARLLRNDSEGGHWIAFRTEATTGHPSGLGARVVGSAGGHGFLREVGAGPSYLSQNDSEILVGLGDAMRVDSITVTWPGGRSEVWKDLAADRRYVLHEGEPPRLLRSALSREETRRFWALDREASSAYNRGEWQAAVDLLREMLALNPDHEDARYDLGNAFLELQRYDEAADAWRYLLRVNPASSRAWQQLGIVHTIREAGALFDLQEAAAAFEAAHTLNPEESRALVLWGEAALAAGDLETARRHLESGYRMNDRAASALYLSGYLAWKRSDVTASRDLLERARTALEDLQPVAGASGEGDTRATRMTEARREADRRRLFGECLDALRQSTTAPDAGSAYPCVDRVRSRLARPGGTGGDSPS